MRLKQSIYCVITATALSSLQPLFATEEATSPPPTPESSAPETTATPSETPATASDATAEQPKTETAKPIDKNKLSYSLGVIFGKQLQQDSLDLDVNAFTQGFGDAYGNKKLTMTDEEISQVLTQYHEEKKAEMQAKEAEKQQIAESNKKAGDAFLAENAKKEGVKTTASGLQYKVITEGSGKKPTAEDSVKVHYRGTLLDGKEFDSSYKRGEPVTFPLESVIPGWTEALQLMSEGSKYQVYIPADLAYGPGGTGDDIPPNSTLIFDIELLEVIPKK